MRELIITIGLVSFLSTDLFSCVCSLKPDFKNKDDLLEYEFISLIKILKIDTVANSKEITGRPVHKIEFEVLELFKGENVNEILISGGNQSLKKLNWTSCDLEENLSEQWVVFAYVDKKSNRLMTGMCTRTYRQLNADGYGYRAYGNNLTTIDKLRTIFNKPTAITHYEGEHIEYFPNGNKSLEEHYIKNEKLDGQRTLWFPNGTIESIQYFKRGKKQGVALWYSQSGQLLTKEEFLNDHSVDTTTHWFEIDTSKVQLKLYASLNKISEDSAKYLFSVTQVSNRHIYNKIGELISSSSFRRDGTTDRITIYDPDENRQVDRFFHSNGILSSELYKVDNKNVGQYREWDQHGDLIKTWEYDKKGLQIKDSIKIGKELNRNKSTF